jgi:hypothetical protein
MVTKNYSAEKDLEATAGKFRTSYFVEFSDIIFVKKRRG